MKALRIVGFIVFVFVIFLFLFKKLPPKPSTDSPTPPTSQSQSSVATTDPSPLDGAIISPTQSIKFTFKKPADQNSFDVKIEPDMQYRIDWTPDFTGVSIVPTKNWQFGQAYTVTVLSGTKFQDGTTLGQDLPYHIQTIQYSGV